MAFLSVGPSGGEMLMVFVVALLLFGPRRLPEIARGIGKALEILRKSSQDFKDQIMRIDQEPPSPPIAKSPAELPPAQPPPPEAGEGEGKESEDDYAG